MIHSIIQYTKSIRLISSTIRLKPLRNVYLWVCKNILQSLAYFRFLYATHRRTGRRTDRGTDEDTRFTYNTNLDRILRTRIPFVSNWYCCICCRLPRTYLCFLFLLLFSLYFKTFCVLSVLFHLPKFGQNDHYYRLSNFRVFLKFQSDCKVASFICQEYDCVS